jgi:hypothetical protein
VPCACVARRRPSAGVARCLAKRRHRPPSTARAPVAVAEGTVPAAVLAPLSPHPRVHGPRDQAMGVGRPGGASAIPWKRTAEHTPAGPSLWS